MEEKTITTKEFVCMSVGVVGGLASKGLFDVAARKILDKLGVRKTLINTIGLHGLGLLIADKVYVSVYRNSSFIYGLIECIAKETDDEFDYLSYHDDIINEEEL